MNKYIVIGSGLNSEIDTAGEYALYFMKAVILFEQSIAAIEAYQQIDGEAYLWDISDANKGAVLMEARLVRDYALSGKAMTYSA